MSKKKVNKNRISILVLIVFVVIGIILILIGLKDYRNVLNEYGEESIQNKLTDYKSTLDSQNKLIEQKYNENNSEIETLKQSLLLETDQNKITEINEKISILEYNQNELNNYLKNEFCLSENDLIFIACTLKSEISKLENMDSDYEMSIRMDKYLIYTLTGSFIIIIGIVISSSITIKSKGTSKKLRHDLKLLKESSDLPEDIIKEIEEKAKKAKKGTKNVKK